MPTFVFYRFCVERKRRAIIKKKAATTINVAAAFQINALKGKSTFFIIISQFTQTLNLKTSIYYKLDRKNT
jgi:hypothetical protein